MQNNIFFTLAFVALLPIALVAQTTTSSTPQLTIPPGVYGNAIQLPLLFEGEAVPGNQVSLSMGVSTLYDDNVLAENSRRLSDEAFSFDSRLGITRHSENLVFNFAYMPYFLLYRQIDQFDRANHTSDLNLTYRMISRVVLGLYDTFGYQNGVYPALTGDQILSGPAPPTALDQMIIPYTTRILSNSAGLNLTFEKSQRTSLTFSGGYDEIKYGSQNAGQPLYNGTGFSGSLTVQYRATEHTSFGILLLHQDITYQGGQVFGNRLRSQIESAVLSVGSRLAPTVIVTVFGGPQCVRILGHTSTEGGIENNFQASGGGSITKEVRETALSLAFQRSVSAGGGLYTSVISTKAILGVRRRLVGRWEADFYGGAAQQDASLFRLAHASTDGLVGRINIGRPLLRASKFNITYVSEHELSKGTLPIIGKFDRNQIAVGIDYQFKALPLGR